MITWAESVQQKHDLLVVVSMPRQSRGVRQQDRVSGSCSGHAPCRDVQGIASAASAVGLDPFCLAQEKGPPV